MAQNLYREWFIKFRFPGHQHARFVDSALGRIPQGWEVRELSEFVDFERGVEPGSKNYASQLADNYIPFLRVGDLGKRTSDLFIEKSFAKGRVLSPDDIAITMDGTVGLVSMGLTGAYSSGIRRVVPKSKCTIGNVFVFLLLQSEHIQAIIESHAKGTTIKYASSSIVHMIFVLPNKAVANAFEEYAGPLNSLALSLGKHNVALNRTRDLLLPKLISGEVDVSELDIAVPEEAGA
jgi:type I restriction enzyme S subunit